MTQTALPVADCRTPATQDRPLLRSQRFVAVGLLLLLVIVGTVRWRFLETPLERDEGEFGYGGQRLLAQETPYVAFHAMKLPGIYCIYALIEVLLGQTAWGIHLGLLLTNLMSIVLMYLIGRSLFDDWAGLAAATAFALLTLSPAVQGTQAQAEHFVLLPALAGALLILHAKGRLPIWFAAGLMFGLALAVKQHGVVFGIAALVVCGLAREWKGLAALALGLLLPLGGICLWMAAAGAWRPFVFWTWTYPREYASYLSPSDGINNLKLVLPVQWRWAGGLWLAAIFGFCIAVRERRWGLLIGCLACAMAIVPGLWFRLHYFVLLAPAIALLVAATMRWQRGWVIAAAASGWTVLAVTLFMLPLTPEQLIRRHYGGFFPESPGIAAYLTEHGDGSVAVLGSEPQIAFYARRKSVTPHIYMYPLMEPNPYALEMQKEVIADVEAAQPAYLIYMSDEDSWLASGVSNRFIFGWLQNYLNEHYYPVGRLERNGTELAIQSWNEAVQSPERFPLQMLVFRRKAGH